MRIVGLFFTGGLVFLTLGYGLLASGCSGKTYAAKTGAQAVGMKVDGENKVGDKVDTMQDDALTTLEGGRTSTKDPLRTAAYVNEGTQSELAYAATHVMPGDTKAENPRAMVRGRIDVLKEKIEAQKKVNKALKEEIRKELKRQEKVQ